MRKRKLKRTQEAERFLNQMKDVQCIAEKQAIKQRIDKYRELRLLVRLGQVKEETLWDFLYWKF